MERQTACVLSVSLLCLVWHVGDGPSGEAAGEPASAAGPFILHPRHHGSHRGRSGPWILAVLLRRGPRWGKMSVHAFGIWSLKLTGNCSIEWERCSWQLQNRITDIYSAELHVKISKEEQEWEQGHQRSSGGNQHVEPEYYSSKDLFARDYYYLGTSTKS